MIKSAKRTISLVLATVLTATPMTAFAQGGSAAQPAPSGAAPQAGGSATAGATAGATTPGDASGGAASNVEEARQRFDRGLRLYDDGNAEAARVEFERAYQLAPNYRILYNIAYCFKQTNDYVNALNAFERYLQEGGSEVPDDRRAQVTKEVRSLEPNIANVAIVTNVEGATVSVDDVPVGKSPLSQKVRVNPGRRKISATKVGMFPATVSEVFAGSDDRQVRLDLVAVSSGKAEDKTNVPAIVGWSLTAALAIGAGVTGGLALHAKSDEQDALNTPGISRTDLNDAHTKTHNLALATDILTVSAVAVGVVSLVLTVSKPKKEGSHPGTLDVRAAMTPGGAALLGRF